MPRGAATFKSPGGHDGHVSDYLPPLPSLEFPVFGLATLGRFGFDV